MIFSKEQSIAFQLYKNGENMFLTGPGGTGKTALIQEIYKDALQNNHNIQVCALTGCAAILLNCNAKTIHSWAGIGFSEGSIEQIIHRIQRNNIVKERWNKCNILIIDEVSMMSVKIFELLNLIGKTIRKYKNKSFGGIQIIFSGDFYQLPPVGKIDNPDSCRFCFESDDWFNVFPKKNHIILITIFRQQDPIYAKILNQIREGIIKKKTNTLLLKYVGRIKPIDMVLEPTKLYPTRAKVDYINQNKMSQLQTETQIYTLKHIADLELDYLKIGNTRNRIDCSDIEIEREFDYLINNIRCDQNIYLKIGAQVMCIINISLPDGNILYNGCQGIIIGFQLITNLPIVNFYHIHKEIIMSRHIWKSDSINGIGISQIPLVLSWAITIHKSQGATYHV